MLKYIEIKRNDILFQIECTNFAGFRRRRLTELGANSDEVIIKKWSVINSYTDYKELACATQSTRNRDMTRRIDMVDYDICDIEFFHQDEQSAIETAKKLWDEDLYKMNSLTIITTSNEKIVCDIR
jgi:hypothetical protein